MRPNYLNPPPAFLAPSDYLIYVLDDISIRIPLFEGSLWELDWICQVLWDWLTGLYLSCAATR